MKPNNPFLVTGYHSPEYFCDRRQETETMIRALYNGRNVTLIAPRRMGKTGLVKNVFYKLREQEPDIVTFYMDIYSTQSLGDFIRLFASTVLGRLDSVPQKALGRVGKFIKSCRPVFTFDELTGQPKVTIDIVPSCDHPRSGAISLSTNSSRSRNIRRKGPRPCCVHTSSSSRISISYSPAASSISCSRCSIRPNVLSIRVRKRRSSTG